MSDPLLFVKHIPTYKNLLQTVKDQISMCKKHPYADACPCIVFREGSILAMLYTLQSTLETIIGIAGYACSHQHEGEKNDKLYN
jgi:hypothetical protein